MGKNFKFRTPTATTNAPTGYMQETEEADNNNPTICRWENVKHISLKSTFTNAEHKHMILLCSQFNLLGVRKNLPPKKQ